MLILAEGTLHAGAADRTHDAIAAWLGPMADDGFLHSGYVDQLGERVWLVLTALDHRDATFRLNDLPAVRNGHVSFALSTVTAARLV